MTVNRNTDQQGPATLTVFFTDPQHTLSTNSNPKPSSSQDQATAASNKSPTGRVESIDMKHKHESEILAQLLELTKAHQYESTSEEYSEQRDVEDHRRRSQRDREAQMRLNEVKCQEKALLDQARGRGVEAS